MTTETTETTETGDAIIVAEATPTPLRMTYDAFVALDVCGDYLSAHLQHYPTSAYPDGPELTEDELARHYDSWNWEWAERTLLTYVGQEEYRRIRSSRAVEYRRFGSGTERRARVMGHLLHHRPDVRSEQLKDACVTSGERAARRALRELDQFDERLRYAREQVQTRRTRLAEVETALKLLEEQLPGLRTAAAPALRRRAEERAEQAARAVELAETEATERLARLRADAERASAALAELLDTASGDEPVTVAVADV